MAEKELGPEFVIMRKISDMLIHEDYEIKYSIIAMSKLICGFFAIYPESEKNFKEFVEDTERYFKHVMENLKDI